MEYTNQTTKELLDQLHEWEEKTGAYRFALTMIGLDANQHPPVDGRALRERRTQVLRQELFRLQQDPKILSVLKELSRREGLSQVDQRIVELRLSTLEKTEKVPEKVYLAFHEALASSEAAWQRMKGKAPYEEYEPYLRKVVELQKELTSSRIEGESKDGNAIFEILLRDHEADWGMERYDEFFAQVKARILPLIRKIQASEPIDGKAIQGDFNLEAQHRYMDKILSYLGFTERWGKIAESIHPLTTGIGENDVRITTKYRQSHIVKGVLSTVHECGHAWYTHNVDPEFDGTAIVSGISAAMHESESRLLENHIGRSKAFWEANYPALQEMFPEPFAAMPLDEFYRSMNASAPSPIRTEADEVTYPVHILIRYEIERDLFAGKIKTEELEKIWNEKYEAYLGVKVQNSDEGILQDMHWPYAYFGYFPSYALGSAIAAQIDGAMRREIPVDEYLRSGQFEKITTWLKEKVQHDGCLLSMDEILLRATGETFNAEHYFRYLEEKYETLYGLR